MDTGVGFDTRGAVGYWSRGWILEKDTGVGYWIRNWSGILEYGTGLTELNTFVENYDFVFIVTKS